VVEAVVVMAEVAVAVVVTREVALGSEVVLLSVVAVVLGATVVLEERALPLRPEVARDP